MNTVEKNHVGEFISKKLKSLKLTQSAMAEYCEVSDFAVTKWKKTGKISREKAVKAAEFLKCTVDELLGIKRSDDEYINQLLYFFSGLSLEHKDDLLYQAQRWHSIDKPDDPISSPPGSLNEVKQQKVQQ